MNGCAGMQVLWSLLLQMCGQDAVEPEFEDMLLYLNDTTRLESAAKRLLSMTTN